MKAIGGHCARPARAEQSWRTPAASIRVALLPRFYFDTSVIRKVWFAVGELA